MEWFRWHHGTVGDPKWRVVAKKSGQPLAVVVAVWAAMLERASEAESRGTLEGWDPEAVAAGLDLDELDVVAIYDAMQNRTLDGNAVTSWERRQPKRERDDDHSTERVRRLRERQKGPAEAISDDVTPRNATERQETPRGEEIREEKKQKTPSVSKSARWRFVPADWQPGEKHAALAKQLGIDLHAELGKFRDHEFDKPKSDPDRAFNRWLRNALSFRPPPPKNGASGGNAPMKPSEFREFMRPAAREVARGA